MVDAERTQAAESHVKCRLKDGKCVACTGTPEDPLREHKKRGLCDRCHARWLRNRAKAGNRQKRGAFDAMLIRQGKLLHEHEIRTLTNHDAFSDALEAISKH